MGQSESRIKEKLANKPIVVIIGGGFAGIEAAKGLEKEFNVLLIDRKDYFFNNIAALRSSVDPTFPVEKILIPYTKLLKFGQVIQAEVTEVTTTGVKVQGREEPIPFDYLLLATGTSYAFPSKVAQPKAIDSKGLYQESQKAIENVFFFFFFFSFPFSSPFISFLINFLLILRLKIF